MEGSTGTGYQGGQPQSVSPSDFRLGVVLRRMAEMIVEYESIVSEQSVQIAQLQQQLNLMVEDNED